MNKVDYLSHNWLAMRINNLAFCKTKDLIKGRVIDMGCGDCQYKKEIIRVADEYIGVDWENSLHACKEVDVFADLNQRLPFSDDYADTITCYQVLEHLREPMKFLSECFRILSSGGRIIINVPFMWGVHEEPHDYYRYTEHGLSHLLGKAGFSEIVITENGYFWSAWILMFNYHSSRYAKGLARLLFVPIWFLGQAIAVLLDKVDVDRRNIASYTVIAFKS